MTERSPAGWVAIASIVRPQGRRGEVLAELLTDLDPEEQFAAGRRVSLAAAGTSADAVSEAPSDAPRVLERHWLPVGKNAGRIVLKLAGCDSISEAERLSGRQVLVPVVDMPALDADTFYVGDLLGCALYNEGQSVGTVVDVHFAASPDGKTRLAEAAPLLGIALTGADADAEPVLVPFVRAYLESVDLAAKRILMHLPAGLLEAGESASS